MRGKARPGQRSGGSNWRRVRTPGRTLEASLLNRYRLRMHGWCIGAFMMAFMWAVSHTQMVLGVESLAVRYLATLGAGYVAYLLVLRLWAARLVGPPAGDRPRNQDGEGVDPSSGVDVADVAEALHDAGDLAARMARGAGGRSPALPRSGGVISPVPGPMETSAMPWATWRATRWALRRMPTRARWWSCP